MLAALVLAHVLLAWGQDALATSYVRWQSDMSRADDSLPPSRPSLKLVAIHRAPGTRLFYSKVPQGGGRDSLMLAESRSSSAASGYVELRVRTHDDRSSSDRLGWRSRLVAGGPAGDFGGGPVPVAEYFSQAAVPDTGWCTLHVRWQDWRSEMGGYREALHAGIVLTCLDRARNESEPSDTVWLDAPACIAVGAVPGTNGYNAFAARRPMLAWKPDATRRSLDRTPPDRPRAKVIAVERGVNFEGVSPDSMAAPRVGTIKLALASHDDQTAEPELGYRLHLAAGELPEWRLLGEEPVMTWEDGPSPFKNGRRLDLVWADWIEGQPRPCCAIHFGLLITSIDRAGNVSAPSDTVWVEATPR